MLSAVDAPIGRVARRIQNCLKTAAIIAMVALALGCGRGSGGDAEQVKALSTQVAELRGRIAQLGGEVDNPETSSQQEPTTPAVSEGHNLLKEWEGRGRKLTKPFTIEKIPWAITWTLRAGLFWHVPEGIGVQAR